MKESAEDSRLVSASVEGQTEAFAALVRKYQDRIFNTLFRIVGNAEDARDLVQDSFVQAYRSLDRFQGNSAFYTWLYRIAVNAAISFKRRRRVTVPIETGGDAESYQPMDESGCDPGARLESDERDRQVRAAIDSLPADFRAVLVLKDIDGQKYEMIAEVMNCPIGTVRSRLHRARLELRARLRHLMEE